MKKKVLILTLLLIATGLFWHCSEEIHDNAVTFGVKHKKPQIKYLKGAEAKLVMNQLEKKVSKSKLRILGKAGTYARSNEGTIDYSEIMQVVDTLGNTNYTFRIINHPEDTEQKFHNLLYSQLDEEIKLILVKYENFDQNYQFSAATTFTTYNLISDDPCPENPIPISGGGGSGGAFDPGIPNPGSGGGGGSVGGYTPPDYSSCWNLLKIYCCHNKHAGEFAGCICPEGERGSTILFNTCNTSLPAVIIHSAKNTNIDPCNPDGDFGVLYPPVKPPCEVLKDLLKTDKQNIKPIINQLKQKIANNSKNEWASSHEMKNIYDPDTNTNNMTYSNSELIEGTPNSVSVMLGTDFVGSTHSHPKDSYPIFSWGDLETLRDTYKDCRNSLKGFVSIQIVCYNKNNPAQPLVYSLRINDFAKLDNKINSDWDDSKLNGKSNEEKLDFIHKDLARSYKTNENNLESFFLYNFKDYGIDLFKANNDQTNWSKLSLNPTTNNPNGELQTTPCP
ncbi:MAG: hypothetical protein ACK4K1_08990 [Flavobacterium sp.]